MRLVLIGVVLAALALIGFYVYGQMLEPETKTIVEDVKPDA